MPTKTLCLDFGNTRMKYAVFSDDRIEAVETLPNDGRESVAAMIDRSSSADFPAASSAPTIAPADVPAMRWNS